MQEGQGPPAGWYDDPEGADRLRWWDGVRWTEHRQAKVSVPPPVATPAPAVPLPPSSHSQGVPVWLWVVGAIVAAVVVVIGLGLIFSWGAFDDQRDAGQDSDAKANVRTVQTALETYAVDNGGSYEGATEDELAMIEGSIAEMSVAIETTADTYSISGESESGNEFRLERSVSGGVVYSCSEAGTGGCEADGTWGELWG